jgi:sugar lactone lactonase YvrE
MFDFGETDASGFAKIPYGILADLTGNIYVVVSLGATTSPASPPAPYIYKFDSNGKFISKWSISGIIETDSDVRRGVAVDSSGNVYVVDTLNNWIQKFDLNGNLLAQWGSSGNGDGQLNHPGGVTVDPHGYIYVADTWNQRIQKFDSSGIKGGPKV